MALIVQKFGGDALGDKGKGKAADEQDLRGSTFVTEKFRKVAELTARSRQRGDRVVVVVSAFGDTTNRLLRMAGALSDSPPARELDMLMTTGEQMSIALLAIGLEALGCKAQSFTGPQVGIRTDTLFGRSRIVDIQTDRLMKALDEGYVPIVAGFQGVADNGEITTLGRGGSDITAVALAAAIGADSCEFYKDVDGIFTTDPRVCASARKIDRISYDEMLELASDGAGILHSRSVEFAKKYGVPLHVRSFLHDNPGTMVTAEDEDMEQLVVSGVAFKKDEAKISLLGVPDRPGIAAQIFSALGQAGIVIDVIAQSVGHESGKNDISFLVSDADRDRAMTECHKLATELGAERVEMEKDIAKVSVVGVGMKSHSNVAGKMFKALAAENINISMISTSEIKISVVIKESEMERAVKAIHEAFETEGEFGVAEEKGALKDR